MGDEETRIQLQKDLGTLQEEWDNLHSLLDHRIDLTETILKVLFQMLCRFCTSHCGCAEVGDVFRNILRLTLNSAEQTEESVGIKLKQNTCNM